MATHSSILAWRISWSLVGYSPRGRKESDTAERLHFHFTLCKSQKKKDQNYGNGSKGKEAGIDTGSKKYCMHHTVFSCSLLKS